MIRALYRFHVYYHVRRGLKGLQVLLPNEAGFSDADHPYTNKEFFKISEDYGVPHDLMRYQDEKFYWTCHIHPDSMTHWIIEKSQFGIV